MQLVMFSTQSQAQCRHSIHRPSSSSLGTSIMPLCPPPCLHSNNLSPATTETIQHWTYANSKEAYNSSPSLPWGDLTTTWCICCLFTSPLTEESEEALRDCFDSTVWEELCISHGKDIDSLTGCISDYRNFCVDNTVPTRTVHIFSYNTLWINPEIKALHKEKNRAFRWGNGEELKAVQKELRKKIRERKNSYRRKMKDQLQQRNVNGVFKSLKTISGQRKEIQVVIFRLINTPSWHDESDLLAEEDSRIWRGHSRGTASPGTCTAAQLGWGIQQSCTGSGPFLSICGLCGCIEPRATRRPPHFASLV